MNFFAYSPVLPVGSISCSTVAHTRDSILKPHHHHRRPVARERDPTGVPSAKIYAPCADVWSGVWTGRVDGLSIAKAHEYYQKIADEEREEQEEERRRQRETEPSSDEKGGQRPNRTNSLHITASHGKLTGLGQTGAVVVGEQAAKG